MPIRLERLILLKKFQQIQIGAVGIMCSLLMTRLELSLSKYAQLSHQNRRS